jgi:glycogen operon protein
MLYFNAHDGDVDFRLPPDEYAPAWDVMIDTAGASAGSDPLAADDKVTVAAKSLLVLRAATPAPEEEPDHSVAASLAVLTQTATTETAALTSPAVPQTTGTARAGKQAGADS